jgi:carbon storage regulator
MLVLTRRLEESIMIGDGIEIQILGIEANKVRVGISAPRDVVVVRKELVGRGDSAGSPRRPGTT